MKLLLATKNLGKILELRSMLKPLFPGLDLPSLLDYPDYSAPSEEGCTFRQIAETKALDAAKTLDMYALSDDSGLCIPLLNLEPGIRSARYAGTASTDKENRQKLITKLMDLKEHERDGYFISHMVLAAPDKIIKSVEGICEGHILIEGVGSQGFGYDSLFKKHDYSKTFAQLSQEVKNKISHRAKALDKLINTFIVLNESKFALSH